MLQSMRHLAQTKVFKALMMLLMVSFAMWGIGDIFRGNALERTVAKAGSVSISVQALNREFEESLVRARQMFGADLTAQQAKQMGVLDKALDAMIERAEVDQAIRKLGIDVSEKTVLDEVAAQPQFRDKDGKFNKALFRQLLDRARLNENNFLAQGRQDIARHQLIDVFSGGSVKPPQTIVDDIYKARGQKRIVEVVTLKNDSIGNIPAPDEKALRDFYQQNPKPFTAPEYRAVTIARLSTDDAAKEITITDEQVQKEYDAKSAQMVRPERRDIVQAVFQDEAKAKQVAASAKANGNLTVAAKAAGSNAVALDQTEEKSLPPELAKPVFALPSGGVSDPLKSSLGWHVVQVKKIAPAGKMEFKDIKDNLRETMKRDQSIEAVTRMVNDLDDQLAAGHALEDIADGMKMRLVKIPVLDAQGKTAEGKDPTELPNKTDVLKVAFSQNAGETSPVMDDKNGNYIVVRTDEVTPSAVRPFEQVKDQVAALWKADEQAKRAAVEAEKIAKALREGKTAASFAGQNGIEIRASKPISLLGDMDPALPPSVLPQIFKLKKGEVATAVLPGQQIILQLTQISEADPAGGDIPKTKIAEELKTNVQNELTEEYLKYLHILFPVEINQDTLETMRQQGS